MSKHTKGPWMVPHFARPDANCECGYVLTEEYLGAVCTVHASGEGDDWQAHGDNPRFEEACANARLIAAAPEMLDALQQAVLAFAHIGEHRKGIYSSTYKAIDAAIKLATNGHA